MCNSQSINLFVTDHEDLYKKTQTYKEESKMTEYTEIHFVVFY